MAWIGMLGAPSRLRKDLWEEEEVVLAYCSSNGSKGEARGIRGRWWISGLPGRSLLLSYAPSLLVRICATSVPVSNGAEVGFGGVQRGGADGGADAKRARAPLVPLTRRRQWEQASRKGLTAGYAREHIHHLQ